MIAYRASDLEYAGLKQHVANAVANSPSRDDYGTLILDRFGQIRSSGTSAEKIFGTTQARLAGKPISAFIEGLFVDGGASSFGARYLAYLSGESEWRKYEAMDARGDGFVIELKLSRLVTEDEELFLLNLRRYANPTHFQ